MRQLGDAAVLLDVEGGHREAQALARTIRARDVIAGATTVGVIGEQEELAEPLAEHAPAVHEIPVVFDGEDLGWLGLTAAGLEREIGGKELEVAHLGFMPGFAYLVGLPPSLERLGRRASPRTRVPAGSFAVAGGYAGIYPASSPGGWNLLGRANVTLFDADRPPHVLLLPGDRVRLVPVQSLPHVITPERAALAGDGLEVLDPGPLSLIEDLGRVGVGSLGVPRAGAANSCWLRIANRAVGNSDGAAAIELAGPARFRALRDVLVALAGHASLTVAGAERPPGIVAAAGAGQEIAVGPVERGARTILAIGGGVTSPRCLGSRSCDAVSGLAPGPLRAGDRLDIGAPPLRTRLRMELPEPGHPVRLRAIDGPDVTGHHLLDGPWVVDARSDRTGVRLRRPEGHSDLERGDAGVARLAPVASHAVVPGAVQLPQAGEPVILGPDCGPVGGYPVAATVITADVWRIGTLAPGDPVEIDLVSVAYAAVARSRLEAAIPQSTKGWYPTSFA